MDVQRNDLRGAGRIGIWFGCFGWLVGLVLMRLPELPSLVGPLVGGSALSVACALGLEALWRRAPRPEFAMLGGIYCTAALLAAYYGWIIEPSVQAAPGFVPQTAGLGARVEHPLVWAAVALVIGAPALLAGLHRRPERAEE